MAASDAGLPAYDDLPLIEALGLRHAWGCFGDGDVLGTVNLLTPERVAAAAAEIRTGERFSLDLPLDLPNPPLYGRQPYRHVVFPLSRNEMDDHVDGLNLQLSTQWDALSHIRCREYGYWGGRTDDPTAERNDLGIDHFADHGLAGRGVLVDVAGVVSDPLASTPIPISAVQDALTAQDVELQPGDILCLRTGWMQAYLARDQAGRQRVSEERTYCGLLGDEASARFLWDSHVAAICADNPAVEVVPGDPAVGSLHRRLIPLLGMAVGELFTYERLVEACRADGRWTFFFVANPLNVPGGIGSPGNAVAIR